MRMKFKEYIDMLINEGYKKGALLNQIRELCGLKTTRAVEYWLTGNSTPDVYKAQIIASYLTNKLNRKITISDLWPVQDLKEVI